jgi:hypothetical protein
MGDKVGEPQDGEQQCEEGCVGPAVWHQGVQEMAVGIRGVGPGQGADRKAEAASLDMLVARHRQEVQEDSRARGAVAGVHVLQDDMVMLVRRGMRNGQGARGDEAGCCQSLCSRNETEAVPGPASRLAG